MSSVAFKENIHNEKTLYKFMSNVENSKNLKLLYKRLKRRVVEMCGDAAVITLMKISSKHGDYEVKVLHYSTSANVSGDKRKDRVSFQTPCGK